MATWEYAPHVNMRGFLHTKSTCSQKVNTLRRDRKLKAIYEYVRVHPFFQGVNFMELSSMDYLDLCHKYINILMYFQDQDILLFLGMGEGTTAQQGAIAATLMARTAILSSYR